MVQAFTLNFLSDILVKLVVRIEMEFVLFYFHYYFLTFINTAAFVGLLHHHFRRELRENEKIRPTTTIYFFFYYSVSSYYIIAKHYYSSIYYSTTYYFVSHSCSNFSISCLISITLHTYYLHSTFTSCYYILWLLYASIYTTHHICFCI